MAHYAFLDGNNVVVEVITGRNEDEVVDGISDWEEYYGNLRGRRCVRTSYNRNIRKNYAGIGFTYDEERDAFIPPQPYPSWILDEETCLWTAPKARPEGDEIYEWNEEIGDWELVVLESDTGELDA